MVTAGLISLVFKIGSNLLPVTGSPSNQPVACSMEAKMCPDGVNYVSRTGPNCEFAACPTIASTTRTYLNEK